MIALLWESVLRLFAVGQLLWWHQTSYRRVACVHFHLFQRGRFRARLPSHAVDEFEVKSVWTLSDQPIAGKGLGPSSCSLLSASCFRARISPARCSAWLAEALLLLFSPQQHQVPEPRSALQDLGASEYATSSSFSCSHVALVTCCRLSSEQPDSGPSPSQASAPLMPPFACPGWYPPAPWELEYLAQL